MKMISILIVAFCLNAGAKSYSQKISLSLKNAPIEKAFKEISSQSGYSFFYTESLLKKAKKITISLKDVSLDEALSQCFKDQLLTFSIVNQLIVIKEKELTAEIKQETQDPLAIEINGKVTDGSGVPLANVSVVVKSTSKGTTTDAGGNFSLSVDKAGDILVFSYVGYVTIESKVAKSGTLNIALKLKENKTEEIVVVGYGSQSKKKVTGAIGSVDQKDIAALPVTSLDQAIQGRLAGVQVTQNSGEPGGGVSLRIRGASSINGSNEPLYVVDGVQYSEINAINPNDIEKIDVLKDGAAAIYGARGANGVVLITTKKGKTGKLAVSFDAYAGTQNIAKKIDLLNGSEFAKLANENLVNAGLAPNPAWSNPSAVQNNDWQGALYRTAPIQSYNLSVSAGGEKSSTLFSFGYFDQEGIIKGSDFKRYTLRLNTDYNLTRNLKIGIKINGAFSDAGKITTNSLNRGTTTTVNAMQPTSPITTGINGLFGYNADGSINPNGNTYYGWEGYASTSIFSNINYYPSGIANEVHTANQYLNNSQNKQNLLGIFFAEYQVIPGLKIKSTISYDYRNGFDVNSYKQAPAELDLHGAYRVNSAYNETWNKYNAWNWINTISYDKNIAKHNFGVVVGTDAYDGKNRFIKAETSGVPNNQQSIGASNGATRSVNGYPEEGGSLMSYFARLNYDYSGKYLLSATIRRDGSSRFAPAFKWANFPSVSVGWRISEEDFMKSSKVFDDLKLRASYGKVGNDNIQPFKYLSTYSNNGGRYNYTLGAGDGTSVSGYYSDNLGDPNIKWEEATNTNIGIDGSLFNRKFTFTADYFIKKIDDMLGAFPIPNYAGVNGNSIIRNGFSMENKGFEFSFGFNQKIGQVNFSANANFTTLNNNVTKLTDAQRSIVVKDISVNGADGGAQTRTTVGEPVGNFWGYLTDGIIQNAAELASSGMGGASIGDRKYKDLNKDGKIDADDKTIIGNGLPKNTFGLNLRAEFKGFDFSVFFMGQAGVDIANMPKFQLYNMRYYNSTGIVNVSKDLLNSWHGEGTSNTLPRNSYNVPGSNKWFSDFYIEDGSFVRIRNVQLGYTLPVSLSQKAGMSRARVFISVQNLHTFTKYTGYDPEIGSLNQDVLTTGTDFGRYPVPKMFTFGVNCQF
jgi:TonB-linked SusC/RagA family outer membrane protein